MRFGKTVAAAIVALMGFAGTAFADEAKPSFSEKMAAIVAAEAYCTKKVQECSDEAECITKGKMGIASGYTTTDKAVISICSKPAAVEIGRWHAQQQ